jgi:type II secretory pathway component PulC
VDAERAALAPRIAALGLKVAALGPKIASGILGLALAAQAYQIAARLIELNATRALAPAAPVLIQGPPRVDVNAIVKASLFGELAAPVVDTEHPPVVQDGSWVLTGTIAFKKPTEGFGIFGDSTTTTKLYKVGASIGGAQLREVFTDHVIIEAGGKLLTLRLPRASDGLLNQPRNGPQTMVAMSDSSDSTASATSPDTRDYQARSPTLGSLDATPELTSTGELHGYKVNPMTRYRRQYGLRAADVVVSVSGEPLNDPQKAEQLLSQLDQGLDVPIVVERDGHEQRLISRQRND